jgi:hypothetical protein
LKEQLLVHFVLTLAGMDLVMCDVLFVLERGINNRIESTKTKAREEKLAMSPPISDLSDSSYILNFTYQSCQLNLDSLRSCDWNKTAPW